MDGIGTMVKVAVPGVLGVPAALVTVQLSWTVPEDPAVKVMTLVVLPVVIVPFVMVQT